jgi:hypothetical protein
MPERFLRISWPESRSFAERLSPFYHLSLIHIGRRSPPVVASLQTTLRTPYIFIVIPTISFPCTLMFLCTVIINQLDDIIKRKQTKNKNSKNKKP